MLTALRYKDVILNSFYLDEDNVTIRRKIDGYHGRYNKHDIVEPYVLKGNNGYDYKGIHIPKTRTTLSYPWVLTILRRIPFVDGNVLDHINGDITDNRMENIRVTSQKFNCKNRRKRYDNKTGHTGINYNNKVGLYLIRPTINGKRYYKSAKTLDAAITILMELKALRMADGYTDRHGK